jgi:deoxyinosine 3'endonuclease (endonuclease V)
VTYREAADRQEELRGRLILRDDRLPDPLRTVAGADISYDRGYRIPEPTRRAHLAVNRLRMEHRAPSPHPFR